MKVLFVSLWILSLVYAQTQVAVASLSATAQNAGTNTFSGTVLFNAINATAVNVTIIVSGLNVGLAAEHGIHVHQFGDISDLTSGSTAGTHYNPQGLSHGCPPSATRHTGDMGNWYVDDTGSINDFKVLDLLELSGTNSIVGLAVVIHSGTDNCINTTSAATRLALGVIGIASGVTGNTASASPSQTDINATCVVVPTSETSTFTGGRVVFYQKGNSITVTASYSGLATPRSHHIHVAGDLRDTSGNGALGHYNPGNVNHSIPPRTPRHAGDLGNIFFINNGTGYYTITLTDGLLTLSGSNSILGRSLILHGKPDSCGQPTGDAGPRIGYCVVGLSDPAAVPPTSVTPPVDFNSNNLATQNTSICDAKNNTSNTGSAEVVASASVILIAAMLVLA